MVMRLRGLPLFLFVGVAVAVVIEVAVLVPVIVTQKAKDEQDLNATLQSTTDAWGRRVSVFISEFMYSTSRTANSAPDVGFWSQTQMEDNVLISLDPLKGLDQLYLWVPFVQRSELAAYGEFYGFNVTHATSKGIVPYTANTPTLVFAPYTLFVPPPNISRITYGFDILSLPSLAAQLHNETRYILAPAALLAPNPRIAGLETVVMNEHGRGFVAGILSMQSLLLSALAVPPSEVVMVAYTPTNATSQSGSTLMYIDPSLPLAKTLKDFLALPISSRFYFCPFTVYNASFVVGAMYSASYEGSYAGQTWVILASVLAPVLLLLDVIVVTLVLLWDRRNRQMRAEEEKHEYALLMLGYVNHEIRNPLQAIMGLAELQLDDDFDLSSKQGAQREDALRSIIRSAEAIEVIARDVLDLRRVEEGHMSVELGDVAVAQLVESLSLGVSHWRSERPHVQMVVLVDPGLHAIRSDRHRVEQILVNFLSNAFKHTTRGEVRLSFAFESATTVRIAVQDTGKGIDTEMQQRLFEKFSQGSHADSTTLKGYGLGLFLSKMLAKLLGAEIGCTSALGEGSTFWLLVPAGSKARSLPREFDETAVPLTKE